MQTFKVLTKNNKTAKKDNGLQKANVQNIKTTPKISILLSTFNGEKYLQDQLDSIWLQDHTNWSLYISDDGSNDNTCKIAKTFIEDIYDYISKNTNISTKSKICTTSTSNTSATTTSNTTNITHLLNAHCLSSQKKDLLKNEFKFIKGPQKGFIFNFLNLVCNQEIKSDYYAFSDQDDIWEQNKLSRSLSFLQTVPENVPALYCSRSKIIAHDGKVTGLSPLFSKKPSFGNAIVQNIGGGNTMVFNDAAKNIIVNATKTLEHISHDWWIYMLITGVGGKVFYDSIPSIKYRQHENNLVGTNTGFLARMHRFKKVLKGRFKRWSNLNILRLQEVEHLLTPQNKKILHDFANARKKWLIPRLIQLKKSGIYRQTFIDNLGLMIAAIFNKI